MINEIEIRKTFEIIKKGDFTEVRVIGNGKSHSGYFADVDNLIKALQTFTSENIYFVLNSITPACYDRKQQECFQSIQVEATKDNDIIRRDWMLIDIDSKRSAGVGSTDEEKKHALAVSRSVYRFMRDVGFNPPVVCDSGNGTHLLYHISLENSADNATLISNVLKVLDLYFSTEKAQIDTVVYNASRITKLYGTVARKGKNTKDRPHRQSRIMVIPDEVKITHPDLLRRVADMFPKPEERSYKNNYNTENFEIEDFIKRHGISVKETTRFSAGTKFVLEHCLFDSSHKAKDAAIFKLDNGVLGYKCFHNSCSSHAWKDVRVKFEPNAYDKNRPDYSNSRTDKPTTQRQPQTETIEKGKKFKNLSEIKRRDRSEITTVQSGFNALDWRIIGFNLREVSIWSGSNGSGKSAILNQICINAAERGFNSVIYSAELDAPRVKQWIQLQAAGRQFVKPSQFNNDFYVPERIGGMIDKWLADKIFIYNNEYGSNLVQLLDDIKEHVSKKKTDIVVIDNVMTLEFDDIATDKLDQQKKAMKMIVEFAIANNVHVHIVAHPRKSMAFLRKEDISGSSTLTDLAYNVLIVHRVTQDFVKRSIEHLGGANASQWHSFSNVIEVCKNRDLGIIDEMFGLYYELESKRFLNAPFDNPVYGWQDMLDRYERQYGLSNHSEPSFDFTPTTEPAPF